MEKLDKFAEHWEGYTKQLLMLLNAFRSDQYDLVRFLCQSHWVHGAKHEQDESNIMYETAIKQAECPHEHIKCVDCNKLI